MARRFFVGLLAAFMLLLPGCGRSSDPDKVVMQTLRDIDGVRKVWTMPWLLRQPDHMFVVELEKDPSADLLSEVIRAYGSAVRRLPADEVALYLRWKSGDQDREITGFGISMPSDDQVRAVADWPTDLTMRAGFYPAQGLVVSVKVADADFPAQLHRVAGLRLKADQAGVSSDRYQVGWDSTPPVARFDAAFAAAPTVSQLRVSQSNHEVVIDSITAKWEQPSDAVRPEMEALVDVWAASPTPLALTLRVGPDTQAALDNRTCPDPESKLPLTQELWEYAERPGHRIVLAPDC
ncbi:hypothetical protein AADG42_17745 [Ammonicoccus fulvus]|uniref:Lipoprotein n=1 Tax=Ammonicoccus fulvus TaxID=3138240 RepID=A0ABZ3FWH1_9ACTN